MPEDKPAGTCFVWVIVVFLFVCLLLGGTFLLLYMIQPESETTSWYPTVGISLVCLPWFFWILLVIYRIVSRKFGFRMVCFGTGTFPQESVHMGGDGGDGSTVPRGDEGLESGVTHTSSTVKNEHDNHLDGSPTSMMSHESEMPLKLSMQS
ncbi:hypothetical protein RND81_10G201000 [Saponaria officinalis]|uniref:Uncharacterized protein n=1 Tax=Saponaria officinalis TaxID=3572 RepID=A0AAW1I6S2_SAPOF